MISDLSSIIQLTPLLKKFELLRNKLEKLKNRLRFYKVINEAVFENAPIGITVRRSSGELLSFNKAWKKIWNLTNRKIVENERKCRGLKVHQRYPYLGDSAPKVQRVFDEGGVVFLPEIHVTDPNSNFDKWISQYYYAIKDANGMVELVVTITQDITNQKLIAQALIESEEKF